MFAGGTDAGINEIGVGAFDAMRALSTRNDAPQEASRPFDVGRDGFVISEGAGILVLEELEHARARGARILAEIVGYGMSSEAFHIALPDETGESQARAMAAALKEAGMSSGRGRLRERPRDVHAGRRRQRDARDEGRFRPAGGSRYPSRRRSR